MLQSLVGSRHISLNIAGAISNVESLAICCPGIGGGCRRSFFKQVKLVANGFKQYENEHGEFPLYNMFGGQMVYVVNQVLADNKSNPYYEARNDLAASASLAAATTREIDFPLYDR